MKTLRAWLLRLTGLLPNARRERELADELESHLQLHIDDNLRVGMTPAEARRQAILKLGGVESTKQIYRERRTIPIFENLLQDVRFSIRQLRENPGFTSTAIVVLALGMCASIAIFAFVDAALIQPLPYRDPTRLVGVFETAPTCPRCNVSYLNFRDWKRNGNPFSSLDVWGFSTFLLRTPTGAEPVRASRVSDGFFRTLGVTPILGRDFYTGEDAPGAPHAVLLSFDAWRNRFGGSRSVLGQAVTLSDISYTVVGVLPREFHFAPRGPAEFWAPLNDPTGCEQRRGCHSLFGVARLKDGTPIQSALAGMKWIAHRMETRYPENRGYGADVVALSDVVAGNIRPILLVLLGGAGLLLLIACLNVSSLLAIRSGSRTREMAVRSALGASQSRITRQFVTEGLVLVAVAAMLGLALADWTMRLLTALIPADLLDGMPFLRDLGLNVDVLAFAGSITLLAAVLFSIVPLLRLSSADLRGNLAEGGRGSAGTLWRRLGSKLVVVELATAVVLLVGAGLLGRSLYRLLNVSIGLQADRLATLQVTMPASYEKDEQVLALERRIVSRIESLPGVKSAGISTSPPLSSWSMAANIVVAGRPWNGDHKAVPERNVSSGYLRTLGARLLRGRYFTEAEDDPSKPGVVIVNQTFARKYFPAENAVGKHLAYENSQTKMEIVGIVEDIKEGQLDTLNRPTFYVPFSQGWFRSFTLAVRTSQEKAPLPALIAAIHRIDPEIGTERAMTMSKVIDDSPSAYLHRSAAWLVCGFAALALLLSAVGLYGVVAFSVSQRTREIGIRMALGAQPAAVYRLVLSEAGRLTALGIVIGLACAVAAATLMRGLLFNVQSWDAPTLAAVAATLGIFALLASYLPARRAASVNPVDALRAE